MSLNVNKERLRFGDYLVLLLVVVQFAACSWLYQDHQKFSFEQIQLLLKGFHAAITGQYLTFGSEAPLIGHNPGALSAWLVGFPFKLYTANAAPAVFQIVLKGLTILIFAHTLSSLFSRKTVIFGTLLFAFNPWLLYQSRLESISYVVVAAVLALAFIVYLRNDREVRRSMFGRMLGTMFLVLTMGFYLQLHWFWPVCLFMVLFLWIRRDIKLSITGLILGLVLVVLSILSFGQDVLLGQHVSTANEGEYLGYGLTHVYPLFKGLIYWFRLGSLYASQGALFPELGDEASGLLTLMVYAWTGVSFIAALSSLLLVLFCNYFTIYRFRAGNSSSKLRLIRGIAISSLLSLLIASGLSPEVVNPEHVAPLLPFALLPVLAYFHVRPNGFGSYVFVAVLFFAFANMVASTTSEKFSAENSFNRNVYQVCLLAFPQQDCYIFASGMSEHLRAELERTSSIDDALIKRVLRRDMSVLNADIDEKYARLFNPQGGKGVLAPSLNNNTRAAQSTKDGMSAAAQEQDSIISAPVIAVDTPLISSEPSAPAATQVPPASDAAPAPAPAQTQTPVSAQNQTPDSSEHDKDEPESDQSESAQEGTIRIEPSEGIVDTSNGASGELILNF